MADWRSFVKGLKVDGGASLKEADVPKEGPPKEPSDWKTFVAALGGSSGARSSGALDGPSVVEFNTETILEFKGKNDIANAYKKSQNLQGLDQIMTIVRGSFLQTQWNAGGTLVQWLVGLKFCAPCCSL